MIPYMPYKEDIHTLICSRCQTSLPPQQTWITAKMTPTDHIVLFTNAIVWNDVCLCQSCILNSVAQKEVYGEQQDD